MYNYALLNEFRFRKFKLVVVLNLKELGRFLVQCGSVAQSPGGGRLRDPSILIFKILGAGRGKKIIVEFKNTQNCENTNVHTMYLFDVMSSSLKNS